MTKAVSIKKLSKSYRMYTTPADRVKELLHPFKKRYSKDFWALRDVSFELERGECIGVMGRNGSGKSTLLQVLCGILQPTDGEVSVSGRVSALLELGAGFDRNFTGRENVYMNGAIMGLKREEVDARYEDIVAFAEIGDFIERPVRTYSSGMYVRLAFACAAHVEPDILVVDEALAVGDFQFRQKCFRKINELRRNASVILVSHNIRDITMLCSKAIVLEKGRVACHGTPEEAADFYMEMLDEEKAGERPAVPHAKDEKRLDAALYGAFCHNKEKITDIRARWVDGSGNHVESVSYGEKLVLEFSFKLLEPVDNLVIAMPVYNSNGDRITAFNTDMNMLKIKVSNDGTVGGRLEMDRTIFNPGTYQSILAILDNYEYLYRNPTDTFRVKGMSVYYGFVTPDHNWEFYEREFG